MHIFTDNASPVAQTGEALFFVLVPLVEDDLKNTNSMLESDLVNHCKINKKYKIYKSEI